MLYKQSGKEKNIDPHPVVTAVLPSPVEKSGHVYMAVVGTSDEKEMRSKSPSEWFLLSAEENSFLKNDTWLDLTAIYEGDAITLLEKPIVLGYLKVKTFSELRQAISDRGVHRALRFESELIEEKKYWATIEKIRQNRRP